MILNKFLLILLVFAAAIQLNGQVTIGSTSEPISGSLLDLKQYIDEEAQKGGRTADRGLALPRVNLQALAGDLGKSLNSSVTVDGTLDPIAHTGLMVYHSDKCTLNGEGLYVWDSSSWVILSDNPEPRMVLSNDTIHMPSGKDARGTVYSQKLEASWAGEEAMKWDVVNSGNLTRPVLQSPASNSGTLTQSPAELLILAEAVPLTGVPENHHEYMPWVSRESKINLEDPVCAAQGKVILNQTNYAIKVNGRFVSSTYPYIQFKSEAMDVESNATWRTVITDNTDGMMSAPNPQIGTVNGQNRLDNTSMIKQFKFEGNNTEAYNMARVTFTDPQSPKRYKDIDISIIKCNEGNFTLEEWAQRSGFDASDISEIPNTGGTLLNADGTPVTKASGVQLHKDQSGNLFLSGDFGDAGRWMLNNLAASKYETNVSTTPLKIELTSTYDFPVAHYPKRSEAYYNANKRVGLMYNYPATVEGKSGPYVQGICPNGWHVPNNKEWIALEIEMDKNTSQYAFMDDQNSKNLIIEEVGGPHGGGHGRAMKDPCPIPEMSINPYGISKLISHKNKPGLNVMMLGIEIPRGGSGYNDFWGTLGSFWMTESVDSRNAKSIYIASYNEWVNYVFENGKYGLMSIRCKKTE